MQTLKKKNSHKWKVTVLPPELSYTQGHSFQNLPFAFLGKENDREKEAQSECPEKHGHWR